MKRELKKLDKITSDLIKSHKISLYLIHELMRIYEDLQINKHSFFISNGILSILENCGLEINEYGIGFAVNFKKNKKTRAQ